MATFRDLCFGNTVLYITNMILAHALKFAPSFLYALGFLLFNFTFKNLYHSGTLDNWACGKCWVATNLFLNDVKNLIHFMYISVFWYGPFEKMEISHPSLGWNKACLQCNLNKHAASAANICPKVSSNANKCRIYWTNYRKPYPFEMPILRWCIYLRASFYISMLIWYYINWTLKKSQLRCTHIPFSNRGKRQIVVTFDFHTYFEIQSFTN